jgi:hypothetical protein
MNCADVREAIVESFDVPGTALHSAAMEHMTACASCTEFHAAQQNLHSALMQRFVPPNLSADFSRQLRTKVKDEQRRRLWNFVPDVVHIAIGILASVVCAVVIPDQAVGVLAVGLGFTLFAYVVQTLVGILFDSEEY